MWLRFDSSLSVFSSLFLRFSGERRALRLHRAAQHADPVRRNELRLTGSLQTLLHVDNVEPFSTEH